jgi:hypothetical protein
VRGVIPAASEPVRAPGGVDRHDGLGHPPVDSGPDGDGQVCDLLRLGPRRVALHEDVAEVHGRTRSLLGRQWRHVLGATLGALLVERQGGVPDTRDGREARDDLLDVLHLRHPPGADEGADLDGAQPGS